MVVYAKPLKSWIPDSGQMAQTFAWHLGRVRITQCFPELAQQTYSRDETLKILSTFKSEGLILNIGF